MGDPKVKLTAAVFETGQNEGIERAVLPLPSLSYLQNARMRKNGRIGKRFGFTTLSTANLSATPGFMRCIGPGFAICDDQCNHWDRTAGAFVATTAFSGNDTARIGGAVSGWLPDTAFFPVPAKSMQSQTSTPCASAFALGYLWTVAQVTDSAATTDQMLRIAATDPTDHTLAFMVDLRATVAAGGGIKWPRLVLIGTTLALFYYDVPSTKVCGRVLTTLAGGFGAEILVTAAGIISYDVSPYTATVCLFAITYGGNTLTVGTLTTALAVASFFNFVDVNPITSVSIVGSPTTPVYVGFGVAASGLSRVRVYTTGFGGGVVGTIVLSATDSARPLMVLMSSGDVRCVSAIAATTAGGIGLGAIRVRDVSALAVIGVTNPTQYGVTAVGIPFAVGALTYIWCQQLIGASVGGLNTGYPILLKITTATNFTSSIVSFPIEMSPQDFVMSCASAGTLPDAAGLPVVSHVGTAATYAAVMPVLYAIPILLADIRIDFRVVQIKHLSDSAQNRSVQHIAADSSALVPMGTLSRIDARGAVETGFVHAPFVGNPVPAAGGGLTASVTYFYTAVFTSRNDSGRLEISAPATPVSVAMGVGQGTNALAVTQLYMSARKNTQVEIYRTLANGQTFYLLVTLAASSAATEVTYTDITADGTLAKQRALYTQVGSQLANGFPPPSRFGCSGGSRVFVGGQVRGDVVTASKLILGDQSPTFCDSDAFKVILPAACTGVAWCDSLVLFTAEGIYVAPGDGPTDDGVGDFGGLVRLPFPLGCIEPRSVFACDDGVFFQATRGLYLLPRGFGTPQAVDAVMDTLASYPSICGAAAMVKATEQTVRWLCVNTSSGLGAQLVYDLVHKTWSVDLLSDADAQYGIGPWFSGELSMFTSSLTNGAALKLTSSTYADNGQAYVMLARTGDLRPFGPTEQGSVQRLSTLLELRGACTLTVNKVSDRGTAHTATRVYTGIAPDNVVGELSYVLTDLGSTEQRSVSSLRVEISESSGSTTEGVALIALALENGAPEGARLNKPADRIV